MERIEHLNEISMVVEDLACKHCIRNLLNDLRAVDGVVAARINSAPAIDEPLDESIYGTATVKYNPAFVQPQDIRRKIEQHGFRVVRFQGAE